MGLADMANAILGHHPGYLTLAAKLDCASFFSIPNTAWIQLPPAAAVRSSGRSASLRLKEYGSRR